MIKGINGAYHLIRKAIDQKEKNRSDHKTTDVKYGFELALLYVKFAVDNKKDPIVMLKRRLEEWHDIY